MANGHVQPGRSLEFYNDTGADIKSGELFPFGGGVAAKALGDIPAGTTGVVTLHDVHRVPVPDGMTLELGQIVRVDGGRLSDSGDILGRFVGLDKGGWAKILIMPLTEEGGGGGGGTTNYNALSNKPRINGVTLSGDKSADDLGISSYDDTALKNRVGTVETAVAAIDAQKLDNLADIKTVGNGLNLDAEGTLTATGTGGDAKAFIATYNVTTAQEIRDYLDAANEPFAPIVVKRGSDYYTAALATKSGDDAAILRVLGSGGGNYILFNYTVRGTTWSSNSYTFQKQLVSGTDIKTVDGQSLLGAGDLDLSGYATTAAMETALAGKQATLVSGTNIKTINGQSLLGSGNMVISGGGTPVVDGTTIKIHNDALMGTAVTAGGSQDKSVTVTGINGTAVEVDLNNDPTLNVVSPMLFNETVELQKKLVSGTNIKTLENVDLLGSGTINMKTVNNVSILGSGNITTGKILYDDEYKNTVIQDTGSGVDIGIVKVDNNTLNINETAPDSRGQTQTIYNMNLPTKGYVDGQMGDLTALTTTAQTDLVSAVNEVKSGLDNLGEPFRVKQWTSTTLDVAIPYCTEDIGNTNIPKMVFTIDDTEGADYQIVGMISYELFDAASGGNRINAWPVCQFTGNGQKELGVRWMCGGTTRKTAKRISAWVLLKHR